MPIHDEPAMVTFKPSEPDLLRKDQLESRLHEEAKLIQDGVLKEDNPLDLSDDFRRLCEACRRGDLKICQEMITKGADINAKDVYDYTPLILVSSSQVLLVLSLKVASFLIHSSPIVTDAKGKPMWAL